MSDQTPLSNSMARELRDDLKEVRGDIARYHAAAQLTDQKVDFHIEDCIRREKNNLDRYAEFHDAVVRNDQALERKPAAETKSWTRSWFTKKFADKVFDWGFLVLLMAVWFAFEHGFKIPLPH